MTFPFPRITSEFQRGNPLSPGDDSTADVSDTGIDNKGSRISAEIRPGMAEYDDGWIRVHEHSAPDTSFDSTGRLRFVGGDEKPGRSFPEAPGRCKGETSSSDVRFPAAHPRPAHDSRYERPAEEEKGAPESGSTPAIPRSLPP